MKSGEVLGKLLSLVRLPALHHEEYRRMNTRSPGGVHVSVGRTGRLLCGMLLWCWLSHLVRPWTCGLPPPALLLFLSLLFWFCCGSLGLCQGCCWRHCTGCCAAPALVGPNAASARCQPGSGATPGPQREYPDTNERGRGPFNGRCGCSGAQGAALFAGRVPRLHCGADGLCGRRGVGVPSD